MNIWCNVKYSIIIFPAINLLEFFSKCLNYPVLIFSIRVFEQITLKSCEYMPFSGQVIFEKSCLYFFVFRR